MTITDGYTKTLRERIRAAIRNRQAYLAFRHVAGQSHIPENGRLLIIPGDMEQPFGSKGDEALLTGAMTYLQQHLPDMPYVIAVSENARIEDEHAHVPTDIIFSRRWELKAYFQKISAYSMIAIIGADLMDGYYSSPTSILRYLAADMVKHVRGRDRATIIGFSFNARPTSSVMRYIAKHSAGSNIFLRDDISLKRFRRAAGQDDAALSADIAFLMTPQPLSSHSSLARFIDANRGEGRTIIGINVHPMLVSSRDPAQTERLEKSFARLCDWLIAERNAAIVLIPHDYRAAPHGDVGMLQRVAAQCGASAHLAMPEEPLSAPQIKQLASVLDAVVSGRMHLAIATLGSGVPVLGVTYQGKFDGLFCGHFGLSDQLLLPAEAAADPEQLQCAVAAMLDALPAIKAQIDERLPAVMDLARSNVEPLRRAYEARSIA